MQISVFSAFIAAFIFTCAFTPLSLIFIKKIGLFDDPKKHKHPGIIHTKPIPRGGGIPFLLGIFVTCFFFLPLTPVVISLFIASSIALGVGVLDDKFDISPYIRFFTNIVTALIVVGSGVNVPFITNPFGGILQLSAIKVSITLATIPFTFALSDLVAVVWIVWVMNMLNWSKGVDGQMPGVVAISAIAIGFLSLRFSSAEENLPITAILSFILAGSALGFLVFNYYPAKIFPGYGATGVYLLLSVVSILSSAKLATAILVMGVPMVDGIFTIIRRIASGKSPFWHDNKHLHHLLLRLGLNQRRIALFYWSISAILGTLSFTLSSKGKLFAIIMLLVLASGGILFLHVLIKNYEKKGN